MTREQLNSQYFEWIYDILCWDKKKSFKMLLCALFNIDFTVILPMDENRAEDGEDLRYRFGRDHEYDDAIITTFLDNRPCSVLEMMAALAIRYEEHIMCDIEYGDRTHIWFWEMIKNLGLAHMSDDHYNQRRVDEAIARFLYRMYDADGTGGIFRIPGCPVDLRNVELWYQGCWYLNTII